jgi:hypothetical protein
MLTECSMITIMLGRFRMTTHDCLYEYKKLSHRIFRKPRLISQPNCGVYRPKYKAHDLETAIEGVTLGRCDRSTTGGRQTVKPLFPMTEGVCQMSVDRPPHDIIPVSTDPYTALLPRDERRNRQMVPSQRTTSSSAPITT